MKPWNTNPPKSELPLVCRKCRALGKPLITAWRLESSCPKCKEDQLGARLEIK